MATPYGPYAPWPDASALPTRSGSMTDPDMVGQSALTVVERLDFSNSEWRPRAVKTKLPTYAQVAEQPR
jgi:hypothetical protein